MSELTIYLLKIRHNLFVVYAFLYSISITIIYSQLKSGHPKLYILWPPGTFFLLVLLLLFKDFFFMIFVLFEAPNVYLYAYIFYSGNKLKMSIHIVLYALEHYPSYWSKRSW